MACCDAPLRQNSSRILFRLDDTLEYLCFGSLLVTCPYLCLTKALVPDLAPIEVVPLRINLEA
jgi:hypothetical protein